MTRLLRGSFSKNRFLLILVILIALLITTLTVYSTRAYEVSIDNEPLGAVKNKAVVSDILEDITKKAESTYGTEIIISSQISYRGVLFASKNKIEDETLRNQMESRVTLSSKAFAINVDGKDIAYLKDRLSAEEVLKNIKAPYILNEEDNANVGFLEKVNILEKEVPVDDLKTPEIVFRNIFLERDQTKKYIVQDGDTVSEIAEKYGLNEKDIQKANPDISIDSISIGQELSLKVPRYVINVKDSTYETSEEKIAFEVIYENSAELYTGVRKVKVKGVEGLKLVKKELVSINGILEETNIISEDIKEAPTAQVVLNGTKERPRTVATGVFGKPNRGSITSRFGERWSSQHTGIDIGAAKGTPNKAADGGVVIFAGLKGNYGKLVIIDHENGFTTYYAHNDTIKVKKGQRVAKGDVIGTVGTTGRTTGPHLHFEIRKNGVPVNPLKYIQ